MSKPSAVHTHGHTLSWAFMYDVLTWTVTLGGTNRLTQQMLDAAQLEAGDNVLDVGCGTGTLAIAAVERVGLAGSVQGIDASPEMVARAQAKANKKSSSATFKIDVIEALSFDDDQFDVVLSSHMMHHLPADLQRAGVAEIYRVLKPGGRIVIIDIESMSKRWSDFIIKLHGGHERMSENVRRLMPLLEGAGFISVAHGRVNRQSASLIGSKPKHVT